MCWQHILTLTLLINYSQLFVQNVFATPINHLHHFIESPKLSHWGEWGKLEHCPSDQVVVGMKLKVHANQGMKDDTGLNAVKFYCQNPYSSLEYSGEVVSISSLVGNDGVWKKDFFCPRNSETKLFAVGFQLRSESSTGVKDDTAGNNLKLICSDLYQRNGFTVLEGDGTGRGEWTKQQLCWSGYAICGLQTQVEVTRSMDTTGLNNLKVRCCKVDGSVSSDLSNANKTGTNIKLDSSSSEDSDSSSSSGEHNHGNDRTNHLTDSDEGGHENGSDETFSSPSEQELVAIDPEPSAHEFPLENAGTMTHSEGSETTTSAKESDDGNLPDEIARIDPVDNSEAHHEDDLPSTATFSSQSIPEDIVNALQDADTVVDANRGSEKSESTVLYETNDIAANPYPRDDQSILHQTESSKHRSSQRFGDIELINTNSSLISSKAYLVASQGLFVITTAILSSFFPRAFNVLNF